jgi:hypothetical protein
MSKFLKMAENSGASRVSGFLVKKGLFFPPKIILK